MACKRRGRACLAKISKAVAKIGWKVLYDVVRDEEKYGVVFITDDNEAHAFKARGDALVFIAKEAQKKGFRI